MRSERVEERRRVGLERERCSTGSMRIIREQRQTRQTKTEFEKAEKDSKKYKV